MTNKTTTFFAKSILEATVFVLIFTLAGCAGGFAGNADLPKGTWCDADGDAILEFKGSNMYVKWWEGQKGRDKYRVTIKTNDSGAKYIVNAGKNEYGFGIMSDIEIRDDGTLSAFEQILDGESHVYRFVPEAQVEEERSVKDLSDDMPKSIESGDIKYFSLSLRHYQAPGLDSGSYTWTVEKSDDNRYESEFDGMGPSYVIISDSREVDSDFVEGIQDLIEDEDLASYNGMFYSHNRSDTEYSLYVKYESGEKLSLKVGSKALDKWCVDNDRFMEYALSIISYEDDGYDYDTDDEGQEDPDDEAENAGDTEDRLLKILIDKTGADREDVKFSTYDDFDRDGNPECFALIGELSDDEEDMFGGTGEIWFVSEKECKKVMDEFSFALRDGELFRIFECKNRKFVAFDEAYVTSLLTYIYYVEDSQPEMSDISRLGNMSVDRASGDYIVVQDSYDNSETYETGEEDDATWTGHTWKPYYFYYDEKTGDFAEYKCRNINKARLADICGFDLCEEIEHEGFVINDIFLRDNGIVNVNYSEKEVEGSSVWVTHKNANYNLNQKKFVDAWGDGENTWQASDYGGIYKPSLTSEGQ